MIRKWWRSERVVVRTLATGILGICALTFLGHAIKREDLASWGFDPPMALNTALCFVFVVACLFVVTRSVD